MKKQISSSAPMFTGAQLRKLIIPLILEQLFAVTIGMADTMMVAGCGEAAVSGISVVDSINVLFVTVFSALATGGAVICSQYLGKKDPGSASRAAKQLLYVCAAIGGIFAVVIALLRVPILQLVYGSLEADVMANGALYFLITGFSLPFFAVYSACAAIFRTMGNSRVSLFTSVIMNLINVGGNAVMILGFDMGVAGAGTATLLARVVGCIIMLVLVVNPAQEIYVDHIFRPVFSRNIFSSILKVAIPSGLENGMFQVGKLLTQGIITTFGTAAISANAVAGTICNVIYICGSGVSLSMITVVGRCVGAREYDQAKRYTLKLIGSAALMTTCVSMSLFFAAPFILSFFAISPEASAEAIVLIQVACVVACFFHESSFVMPNSLRASGDVRFTMTVSVVSMWTMRVLLSYVLA
ncbi:MAG: MATE family efflux transporter, partial [Clostridia bacterium]|nr:MATE family efflux transporter [Clostridia bacterium]